MKKYIALISSILVLSAYLTAQVIVPPYFNSFDLAGDTAGWSHYPINGTDQWELGNPSSWKFTSAYSYPNAWVTDLDSNYLDSVEMVLESPFLDLSDTTKKPFISFQQMTYSVNCKHYLEYALGNSSWTLLINSPSLKKNWQSTAGFSGSNYNYFVFSAHSLDFLVGEDSVRFRFRFQNPYNYTQRDGWMIDDFQIGEEFFNIKAEGGDTIYTSPFCGTFNAEARGWLGNTYDLNQSNMVQFYFSTDSILDPGDTLLATKYFNTLWNFSQTKSLNLPPGTTSGLYYIIYKHDAINIIDENDETDNIAFSVLKVEPVNPAPIADDFEGSQPNWQNAGKQGYPTVWELGEGYKVHIENAHSGVYAWHNSRSLDIDIAGCGWCDAREVVSPYYDLTTDTGFSVLSLWYKAESYGRYPHYIQYSKDCGENWVLLHILNDPSPDDWSHVNISLDTITTPSNIQFRVRPYWNPSYTYLVNFDDVYVGAARPDLSIEGNKSDRFTRNTTSTDTLWYQFSNSGLATADSSTTSFYWSTDSILDGSDVHLGNKQEVSLGDTSGIWTSFVFSKPTASAGKYFILYSIDSANVVDEMREYNNQGYFEYYQGSPIIALHYNNFESQVTGWRHNASMGKDEWEWGVPQGQVLKKAFSGSKAWISQKSGRLAPQSMMHLYTPIFNFSFATNPVLEFDMLNHAIHYGSSGEGTINMTYSIDGGATWVLLDTTSQSYNRWYYPEYFNGTSGRNSTGVSKSRTMLDDEEKVFAHSGIYNGRDTDRNTRYILDVAFLAGYPEVQFRYNITSSKDTSGSYTGIEGAMIDNFRISEKFVDMTIDYEKKLMISSMSEELRFFMHVKNQGNYSSVPSIIKYYVSADTVLDVSDHYIGQTDVPAVRPDNYYYINEILTGPDTLSNYNYLYYVVDASNTNIEQNENNNEGFWELALDSIHTYPYLMDFEDTVLHGWHQYSQHIITNNLNSFRFRNKYSELEQNSETHFENGQMATEWQDFNTWSSNPYPYFYLETPAFNFRGIDSIFLSFDLMCTGLDEYYNTTDEDGGNLQFSVNGGNTWVVLTEDYGVAHNWYNDDQLYRLNDEPGWTGNPNNSAPWLDSTTFDASFLKGQEHVVFRFFYHSFFSSSSGRPQGMRIDNFKVEGISLDLIAQDSLSPVSAQLLQDSFALNYKIRNFGPATGGSSKTNFYWSTDSILDSLDMFFKQDSIGPVSPSSTSSHNTFITYPKSISQLQYYLFYQVDADSSIEETLEDNNQGSFVVAFDSICGTKYDSITETSCDSLLWTVDNTVYTSSGFHSASLLDKVGCDSIITMDLTLLSSTFGIDSAVSCDQYMWPVDSSTYYSSGLYTGYLTNAVGCDSIVSLNLVITNSSSSNQTVLSCNSYTWPLDSAIYFNSGVYSTILTNSLNCDSTVTLNLTINNSDTVSEYQNACLSYTWPTNNQTYTVSGNYPTTLSNANGCDSLVTLHLTIYNSTSGTESVSACYEYTWPTDQNTYYSSGTYTALLTDVNGCDSTATLNLTINKADTSVSTLGNALSSNAATATYQWLDCDNNYAILPGETNKVLNPKIDGTYAVAISQNGCLDTSACFVVEYVGIYENDFGHEIAFYPNPTTSIVHIDLGSIFSKVEVSQRNLLGEIIYLMSFKDIQEIDFNVKGVSGSYYIDIASKDGKQARLKIIKQ